MADVEVAAGIFRPWICAVLRQERADVKGILVQGVGIRVPECERQSVRCSLRQRRLESVVVGSVEVRQKVDDPDVWELVCERQDAGRQIRLVQIPDAKK